MKKKYFSLVLCGLGLLSGCGGGSLGGSVGGTPSVTLSVTDLTFGFEAVGTTSAAQTVTLSNSGTATLSIVSIAASANFGETNTCGSTLASGANCIVTVTFTPSTSDTINGTLLVTDNAPGSPQSVALSGNVVFSGPNATLSATSLTFACRNVNNVGCECETVGTPTLTNFGSTTLSITGIGITGAAFSETNNCDTNLGAGKSCTITVKWSPPMNSLSIGAVSVSDNAADSPQFVSLTGIKECSP